MTGWLAVAVAWAGGTPLVAEWPIDAVRTAKVDLFSYGPGTNPPEWVSRPTTIEQWTMVVECRVVAPRTERCTMPRGVWLSVAVEGTPELRSVHVDGPPAVQLVWTPRGRLASWDVQGDRTAFRDAVTAAWVSLTWFDGDTKLSKARREEMGQAFEEHLTRGLAAALEWELPKKGVTADDGSWKSSEVPWAARMRAFVLLDQGLTTGEVVYHLGEQGPEGRSTTAEGKVGTMLEPSRFAGTATLDATGRPTRSQTQLVIADPAFPGHTHQATLLVPWKEGDPEAPADLPAPLLATGP